MHNQGGESKCWRPTPHCWSVGGRRRCRRSRRRRLPASRGHQQVPGPLPPAPQLFNFVKSARPKKTARPKYETVTVRPSFRIPTVLLGAPGLCPTRGLQMPPAWSLHAPLLEGRQPGAPWGHSCTLPPPIRPAGTAAAAHFGHVDAVAWVTGVLGAFLAFQASA